MSQTGLVRVEGAREFRATCKKAAVDLSSMQETHWKASALVWRKAVPRTPKRTGRLAASVRNAGTKTAAIVRAGSSAVPYAGVIHWGWPARNIAPQPWIADTAAESRDEWLAVYEAGVQKVLNTIRGA